ncbi:MAG: TolC family protein [Candidatus Margulisiibacteriota bacterium]|nr:TolC family protein [Candidatus Margulisiibacteriota bacterium]
MRRFSIIIFVFFLLIGICSAQEDLTLEKSILIAFEKSPVMLKARADIVAAEGQVGQAVAGFLPHLSLNANVGKTYSAPMTVEMTLMGTPSVFTYGVDEQADMANYSASLTQSLFTGGRLSSGLAMAKKGLRVAVEEFKKVSHNVKFSVIKAYYDVLKAKKFVKLSRESVDMANSHLSHAKALKNVGMSTRAETLRDEVQVANAEIALSKAKQGFEIAKNYFNNILGRDLNSSVELAEVEFKSESEYVPLYEYEDILKIAYEERPDWKQYILANKISEDEVGMVRSDLWPMLSLVGQYDIGSTKYESFKSDQRTWTAMVSGSWNIFDGSATWNRIKEANAKLEANRANEIEIKKGIALEVKDANFAISSSLENIKGTQKALELAGENLKIADLRYKSGVGTNLEMIDAQVAVTRARIEHLQSEHDLQIAKAKINKVIGRDIY